MKHDQAYLSQMLETAVVAARLAGQRAMEEMSCIRASVKNGDELVTQADGRCQQIVIDRIKENYPDHGFIAEEGAGGKLFKQPPRSDDPVWWVIDPIDGTNNYARGLLCFCVSIAAVHDGVPIVGAIFDPTTESMFTATINGEPQLNARKIAVSADGINQLSSIGLDSHFDTGVPPWAIKIMNTTKYRNLGATALHLAYVAKGALLGTIASRQKLWDIAAGALIAERAGAIVTDWQGNKLFPLDAAAYTGQPLQILAASKKAHPELVGIIKS